MLSARHPLFYENVVQRCLRQVYKMTHEGLT